MRRNRPYPAAVIFCFLMACLSLPAGGSTDPSTSAVNVRPHTVVVVRVSPTGNDANAGSSWELPKRTIRAAIEAVSKSGGEVWVKEGKYREQVVLKPSVSLYGGFGGTETRREERDWNRHVSTIDGLGTDRVVSIKWSSSNTVDGFTVQNGGGHTGAGVCCAHCKDVVISNNTIRNNAARFRGGGIFCGDAAATFVNNWIADNSTSRAESYGGGICCIGDLGSRFVNNTITGNRSPIGSAIYLEVPHPSLTIANNIIAQNSYGKDGSAIVIDGHTRGEPPCRFRNNNVWNGKGGRCYSWKPAPASDISKDPLIADPDTNPRIQPNSPCVNRGWSGAPGLPKTDMDGQARRMGAGVDIGADESDGRSWSTVTITAEPDGIDHKKNGYKVGDTVIYRIKVKDPAGRGVANAVVRIQVKGQRLTYVTSRTDGKSNGKIDTPLTAHCPTNVWGEVYVQTLAGADEGNCFMEIGAAVE